MRAASARCNSSSAQALAKQGWWAALIAAVAFCGCSVRGNASPTSIFIDDGMTSTNGFSISAVDGKPPTRWHGQVVTTVPFVLVEPGRHTFTVEGDKQTFEADIQPGKRYRTAMLDDKPLLVEEEKAEISNQ